MNIGFDEFQERLAEMEGRLAENIRNALFKNALRMEKQAKINATSFPKVQTGRLRNSIIGTVLSFQDDEFLMLRAGGLSSPTRPFSESADVEYAAVQEFGGGIDNIIPKFYLRRARDKVMPRVEADIQKAVGLALEGKSYV